MADCHMGRGGGGGGGEGEGVINSMYVDLT